MHEIPQELRGLRVVPLWHADPTRPTAAKLLGISKNTAYAAAKSGEIPTIRLGVQYRVPVAKLLDLLGLSDQTPAA